MKITYFSLIVGLSTGLTGSAPVMAQQGQHRSRQQFNQRAQRQEEEKRELNGTSERQERECRT
ncbi:MAG TPA: hypothetical protein VFQ43_07680, partial [Nitrososphaera sp.]|nr:hypothetical protein [Nitrososphaera sp.]